MDINKHKVKRRIRRHRRVRGMVTGTPDRPRLCVFRSLNHIYVQVVDDLAGRTLAAASSREKAAAVAKSGNCASAATVGKLIAERARAAGVKAVRFDRGGFKYHGRVKALADAARKEGLAF
ncbi:MAG: 50S ribosomal protein L18 [Phycisphaerae bacterium]|nr:50S ribosomal protein L18 [Phycisphaerae bacterium]